MAGDDPPRLLDRRQGSVAPDPDHASHQRLLAAARSDLDGDPVAAEVDPVGAVEDDRPSLPSVAGKIGIDSTTVDQDDRTLQVAARLDVKDDAAPRPLGGLDHDHGAVHALLPSRAVSRGGGAEPQHDQGRRQQGRQSASRHGVPHTKLLHSGGRGDHHDS